MTKHRKKRTFAAVENLHKAEKLLARYEAALREILHSGDPLSQNLAYNALAPDETEGK